MTRHEITVERIVVHGLPRAITDGLGPLVEERLALLASSGAPSTGVDPVGPVHDGAVHDGAGLAALVAHRIWAEAGWATGRTGRDAR